MRIISGTLRGAIIPTIKGADYRPSTGKFKEALFSILTSGKFSEGFAEKNVLDLFAGTGSLGLEALSRGAALVTFVDIDISHLNVAKSFAEKHKLLDKANFIRADSMSLLPQKNKYDIVFLDPPYGKGIIEKSLYSIHKAMWLNNKAILVIEVGSKEEVTLPKWYSLIEQRIYGGSKMVIAKYESSLDL